MDALSLAVATLAVLLATAEATHRRQTAATSGPGAKKAPSASAGPTKRPNIVLILTDDQDVELGSLDYMPETTKLLRNGGAELRHAYTTTPMCCPSRSSLLTGLYVHNHNVYTNNDNCSSTHWQTVHETRSFATYLAGVGYHTGYYGKYLNKYNGSYIPPGWKDWGGLIMNSKYYNYSINLNGKKIRHGDDYYQDYYPDLIVNDSISFLRQWKHNHHHKPTMLVMSFPAPHGPEDSAPQYSDMFFNVTSHHTSSYNYAPNPDKQWILRYTGRMQPIHNKFTDLLMTKRLQTLQSVDAAVSRLYRELKELGELENTFIVYTSDHGYHLGQFGLIKGKSFPFEFDVRVPFLVRGPGIEPGTVLNEIALNIDLAPTFLDMAGIPTPPHMDGRSLLRLFRKKKKSRRFSHTWPDTFLIESSGRRDENGHKHPVTENDIPPPLENDDDEESKRYSEEKTDAQVDQSNLFVNEKEPYSAMMQDMGDMGAIGALGRSGRGKRLKDAHFAELGIYNKAERLAYECQLPDYSTPCVPGQTWHCIYDGHRWRKHKCRFNSPANEGNLKKCTCITEEGIVYTRFQTSADDSSDNDAPSYESFFKSISKRKAQQDNQPTIVNLMRSNKTSDQLVDELAKRWRVMKRHRRQSNVDERTVIGTHVNAAMDMLSGQINGLVAFKNESANATCIVTREGDVSCAHQVYDSPELWQLSQQSIEARIKQLQEQMDKLKDIQKHLFQKQPKSNDSSQHSSTKSTSEPLFKLIYNSTNNGNLVGDDTMRNASDDDFSAFLPLNDARERDEFLHKKRHHHNNRVDHSNSAKRRTKNHEYDGRRKEYVEYGSQNGEHKLIRRKKGRLPDTCYCVPYSTLSSNANIENNEIIDRNRLKEEKLKKKERKMKKKASLDKECVMERMNCFTHDNDHWKTAPLWTEGPFCFCMNANNNTYSCLRTINATHNFLYCEFITGFTSFYDMKNDPYQQLNVFDDLPDSEKSWLKWMLSYITKCKGSQCTVTGGVATKRHYKSPYRKKQYRYYPGNAARRKFNNYGGINERKSSMMR